MHDACKLCSMQYDAYFAGQLHACACKLSKGCLAETAALHSHCQHKLADAMYAIKHSLTASVTLPTVLSGPVQGFYDRSKLFWKDIDDTTLVAACAPPGILIQP